MKSDTLARSSSISREVARSRCESVIEQAFEHDSPVLVEALPAMGKSSGAIRWAARTGNPLVVFTSRHELYAQYAKWCRKAGLNYHRLASFHYDCPCMDQENGFGAEWRLRLQREYEKGWSARDLHEKADELFGESLPCEKGGPCPYLQRLDDSARNVDVRIGHYTHAYNSSITEGKYVAFDEFPGDDFLSEYSSSDVASAVSRFLAQEKSLPFEDYTDLIRNRWHPDRISQLEDWIQDQRATWAVDPSLLDRGGKNARAEEPLLTLAVAQLERLDNRWGYADLGERIVAVQSREDETLTLFTPPRVADAKQVIALDGTPRVQKWKLILGENLRHIPTLADNEKNEYIRNGLGLKVIQTTFEEKPYAGGISVTPEQDVALLEAIKKREGASPDLITSKVAISEYKKYGFCDIVGETEHYHNLKGSNKFEETRLGVVIGTPRPSDGDIERWAALFGKSVQRLKDEDGKRTTGMDTDFGRFGNIFLWSVREDEVLQAVMRFGRKEKGGERGATVYVHTAALPNWLTPDIQTADIAPWRDGERDGMKQIVDEILAHDEWRTDEWRSDDVEPGVDISIQQVRTHLRKLAEEYGYIGYKRRGRGGTYYWYDRRLNEIGEHGHVTFISQSGDTLWDSLVGTHPNNQ